MLKLILVFILFVLAESSSGTYIINCLKLIKYWQRFTILESQKISVRNLLKETFKDIIEKNNTLLDTNTKSILKIADTNLQASSSYRNRGDKGE